MEEFLGDFSTAWRDARMTRLLAYGLLGALIFAIVVGALGDLTRPRIYVVRDEARNGG